MPRAPASLLAVAAVLGALGLGVSFAQRRRVLHEPLPPPPGAAEPSPLLGSGATDRNPAAIAAGDKVLPAPPLARPAAGKEPVLGTSDFGADRDTETPMDRQTGADGTLHYTSVFNPDVLPFKRMSALDGVREDATLFVTHTGQVELPVGGASDRSRDRFWGSMPIKVRPGVDIPLPSVAPDMRILSYETDRPVRLVFSKDGADNFFVRSDEPGSAGTYRLVFLADADARYFAPDLPAGNLTPRKVWEAAPPELRARLPPGLRGDAARVLRDHVGVDENYKLEVALNRLIAYFRAFEAKDPPPDTGNIYLDLCTSQAGVCRHRSFAFMITANALGIPTRFVSNEAHAFVEIWLPERGWQRIDLGGAALRLEVAGGEGKTLHRPRAEDPFAKPPEYSEGYTQLTGDIQGLTREQIADRQRPRSEAPASGEFDTATSGGTSPGKGPGRAAPDPVPDSGRITPDRSLPVAATDPKKITPVLTVSYVDARAYRGGKLRVDGSATAAGAPLADRPIDIYISRDGADGANASHLRRVTTGADGKFSAEVEVPATLKLARYQVHISSPEDARYNAALSQ